MKERITILPSWCITNRQPAFLDVESKTAIEMVGKVYAAMRELQEDYNKYTSETTAKIDLFIADTNTDYEKFKAYITKTVHDYIAMLDAKVEGLAGDYVESVHGALEEEIGVLSTELTTTLNNRLAEQDSRIAGLPSELNAYIDQEVADAFEEEVVATVGGEY